jgi:hypothetical protein
VNGGFLVCYAGDVFSGLFLAALRQRTGGKGRYRNGFFFFHVPAVRGFLYGDIVADILQIYFCLKNCLLKFCNYVFF